MRQALLAVLSQAEAQYDQTRSISANFLEQLEGWYNGAMDRVSGWYRRKMLGITLFYSLLLVLCINGDSLKILRGIYQNNNLRSVLVTAAGNELGAQSDGKPKPRDFKTIKMEVEKLGVPVPLGYSPLAADNWRSWGVRFWLWRGYTIGDVVSKTVGMLATVLAISLGAPFWFDLLKRAVSIRGTGDSPSSTKKPD